MSDGEWMEWIVNIWKENYNYIKSRFGSEGDINLSTRVNLLAAAEEHQSIVKGA